MATTTFCSYSPTTAYIGLSTDTKPTNVPAGTPFWESDTGFYYLFDGTSTWFRVGIL